MVEPAPPVVPGDALVGDRIAEGLPPSWLYLVRMAPCTSLAPVEGCQMIMTGLEALEAADSVVGDQLSLVG